MADVMSVLGERIKRLRQERGWTQYRLSRTAGVPQVTIARLERFEQAGVDVKVVRLIAKAFGVGVDYLVGTNEPDVEQEPAAVALVGA